MSKSKSKKPASALNKRLPTVFDYSALRLHPDGRRVQQRDSRRINDIDHVPNTVLSRTGWIAADAGGKLGGYKRVKSRVEKEGEDFDMGEDKEEGGEREGGGEGRKGKEREVNEEEERPRKKRKKDVRTERRREFLDDWSFLDGLDTLPQSQPSSRGLSRHVTPGQSNPTQDVSLPLPSSGLLKCIHHFASSYYTEQGQMLQISSQYRKEKKELRMKKLGLPLPTKSLKSKSHDGEREGDSSSRGSSPSSSDSEDEADPNANKEPKPKRKPAKLYRDMYKMFDGTALMAIGMLIQSHVESLLKPNVPEHWERDVRLTWGAPLPPRAPALDTEGTQSTAEGAQSVETSNQTEWEQTVQKDRLRREKAREYDDNEFYRSMLEGVDEYVNVRWRKIKTRKKVVEESDEEESGEGEEEGEGEGKGEGEGEGERGEGDGDGEQEGETQKGDMKGKGKAKASPSKKGKKMKKAAVSDGSPRKGGRKSKVVFKSAEVIEFSDDDEGREGGEPASAPAIACTSTAVVQADESLEEDYGREDDEPASAIAGTSIAAAAAAVQADEFSEDDEGREHGEPTSASAIAGPNNAGTTAAGQADPNTADNEPVSTSASQRCPGSQPAGERSTTPSAGSIPTTPLPPPSSRTAPTSRATTQPTVISPTEGSTSTPLAGLVSNSTAEKKKIKRKDKEAGISSSVTQPLASSSPLTTAGLQAEGTAPASGATPVATDIVLVEDSASRLFSGPVSSSAAERKKRKRKEVGALGSAAYPLASSPSSSSPITGLQAEGSAHIPENNDGNAEQAAASTPLPSSSTSPTATAPAQTQSSLMASQNSFPPSAPGISSTSGVVPAALIQANRAVGGSAPHKKRKLASTTAEGSTALPSSSSASPALQAWGPSGVKNTRKQKAALRQSSSVTRDSVLPSRAGISSTSGKGSATPILDAEGDEGVSARKKRKVTSAGGSTAPPSSAGSSGARNTTRRSVAEPLTTPSSVGSAASHAPPPSTRSNNVRNKGKRKATESASARPRSALAGDTAEVGDASAVSATNTASAEAILAEETPSSVNPASAGSKGKKRKAPPASDGVKPADGDRSRKKKRKPAPVPKSKEAISQGGFGGGGDARDVDGEEPAPSIPQTSGSTSEHGPTGVDSLGGCEARQSPAHDTEEGAGERRALRARKTIKYTR